jgi:hypothetical protein
MSKKSTNKHLVIELDQIKAKLQELVDTIKMRHGLPTTKDQEIAEVVVKGKKIKRKGAVRSILEFDSFKIGIGLKLQDPPLPDYALKIAQNLGNDISPNGIVFEVKGRDFEAMYEDLNARYLEWFNRVSLYRKEHNIQ